MYEDVLEAYEALIEEFAHCDDPMESARILREMLSYQKYLDGHL